MITLTSTEAIIRCHSGATLKFYRRSEPALAGTANVAPATEIGDVMPTDGNVMLPTGNVMLPTDGNVMLPIGNVMLPTLQIAKGATA